jgi:mannose-6-phosphate isomerase-like protein (cupin superfamily)
MGIHYRHEGEEFISVLEGNVEMKVGKERNALATSQSLLFNSAIIHKLRNFGDKPARFIAVIYTPLEWPQGRQHAARGVYSVFQG